MGIARSLLLWASTNRFLAERLPRYGFVRRAVRKFMPGEKVPDALAEAERLRQAGIATVLTYLGENVAEGAEADDVARHYLGVLDQIAESDLDTQISVKLTQLGLDIRPELCQRHLVTLAEHAAELGNFVWVDIESSPYVDATLDQFRRARSGHDNLGLCLQAYLYRTADDLEDLLERGAAIRLVKGAYKEPPDIAFPKKADVDNNFFELARRLLESGRHGDAVHGIATHDEALVERILASADASPTGQGGASDGEQASSGFEIQMLYGIQVANQRRWASEGHCVRVLISYGDAWYPWYVRRLAERPANVWFVVRNIFKS